MSRTRLAILILVGAVLPAAGAGFADRSAFVGVAALAAITLGGYFTARFVERRR